MKQHTASTKTMGGGDHDVTGVAKEDDPEMKKDRAKTKMARGNSGTAFGRAPFCSFCSKLIFTKRAHLYRRIIFIERAFKYRELIFVESVCL